MLKDLNHKTYALASLYLRSLCLKTLSNNSSYDEIKKTVISIYHQICDVEYFKDYAVVKVEELNEYIDWIDIDFISNQSKTSEAYISDVEAYLHAILFVDLQKVIISPWLVIGLNLNLPELKEHLSSGAKVNNYSIWRAIRRLEKIKVPPKFSRRGEEESLIVKDLVFNKNSPLYYWIFRSFLLSSKIISEGSRIVFGNLRELYFRESNQKPTISIVIPVYGAYDLLNQTLISLHRIIELEGLNCEIICVDDCSPDYSDMYYKPFHGIKVLKTQKNLGFSKACNFGVKNALGDYIFLLNSDVICCSKSIKSLYDTILNSSKVGVVGSRLLNLNGSLQEGGGVVWGNGQPENFGRNQYPRLPQFEFVRDVDYVSGASFMVAKTYWHKLGGFDVDYSPAYYEDTDFCIKSISKGFRVIYQPKSCIYHAEGGTNGTNTRSGVKIYQKKNEGKFKLKWGKWLAKNRSKSRDVFAHLAQGRKIIVFVDHYIPRNDRDAGSKATFDLLEFLSKKYFVIFWPDNLYPDPDYYDSLSNLGIMVITGSEYIGGLSQFVDSIFTKIEWIILSRPHISIDKIKQFSNKFLEKTLYVGHDIHHERIRREIDVNKGIGGQDIFNYSDHKLTANIRSQELYIWKKCASSLYFTERECRIVDAHLKNNRTKLIPLYSPDRLNKIMQSRMGNRFASRGNVVFAGGFDHGPNLDGLSWLLGGVTAKDKWISNLVVIGSNIPVPLKKRLSDLGAKYYENITNEHLDQLYQSAKIVLVPLRYGSGLKGKVMEAFAYGVPVVSTSIGLEGLSEYNSELSAFNDLEGFLGAIQRYLSSSNDWHTVCSGQDIALNEYMKVAKYSNIL
jgi:GT2 family glycosyltransferase